MPTSFKVKRKLIEELPDTFEGKIADLGSGWGTLLFALAEKYPHAKIIGYETSPIPYFVSKILCCLKGKKNIQLQRVDFFEIPWEQFDMVICYLYPGAMREIEKKVPELHKNALLVSHTFALSDRKPGKEVECPDLYRTKIYFYWKE